MKRDFIGEKDRSQIETIGITEKEILSQIEKFEKGAPYIKLNRPCMVNDGIRVVSEKEAQELIDVFDTYAPKMVVVKFVPASGAASRMFKTLLKFNNEYKEIKRDFFESQAKANASEINELIEFMEGIYKFAFTDDLRLALSKDGFDIDKFVEAGEFKRIIEYLLTAKGLNYSKLPKGLIKFHSYKDGTRTAFEEHMVEAEGYIKNQDRRCRLHFTVSPEHKEKFLSLLEDVKNRYEKHLGVEIKVDFSVQDRSTDTIAVDMNNQPFRLSDGTLLFRPGGHGALIKNLNGIRGDLVFIKNIDNVVPDRLKAHTFYWKKVLGGILIQTQQKIFSYIKRLSTDPVSEDLLREVVEFAKTELSTELPENRVSVLSERTRKALLGVLNRPLRVCGMVRNVGEPGGGPFWVEGKEGTLSLQIVESAQVDPHSVEQQKILTSSTHFNPVDIVCGFRDWEGKSFDLEQYVDTEAVFISKKSKNGRDLKALELPGLWNGGMAFWNTIFVEVPLITFNPVKTVNDLLREEHQSESG